MDWEFNEAWFNGGGEMMCVCVSIAQSMYNREREWKKKRRKPNRIAHLQFFLVGGSGDGGGARFILLRLFS